MRLRSIKHTILIFTHLTFLIFQVEQYSGARDHDSLKAFVEKMKSTQSQDDEGSEGKVPDAKPAEAVKV